jgi:aryl-alcohol dehydrogenase-like predicted oxidoreductase
LRPGSVYPSMQTRKIGSLDATVVGLGCNNFGWRIDTAATARVVDAALDAGVTFFDTADVYGEGKSEEFLAQALSGRWNRVVLATKFGSKMSEDRQGAAPAYVKRALEDSLRRLGTDRVDLYQLHRPDPKTPIADTLGALSELVREGKVREIGCSNFSVDQIREAESAAKSGVRFVSVQNEYSLMHREPEKDVVPECESRGIAFLPYFPLANGLLTGKYRLGRAFPSGSRADTGWGPKVFNERNLAIVESLAQFAESRGHTVLDLAFSWLLAKPAVASVIAGASSPEQVRTNAAAAFWELCDADLAQIESIVAEGSRAA